VSTIAGSVQTMTEPAYTLFGSVILGQKVAQSPGKNRPGPKNGSGHKPTFVSSRPVPKPDVLPVHGPEEKLDPIGPEEKQRRESET
jgi:hypothetical protein